MILNSTMSNDNTAAPGLLSPGLLSPLTLAFIGDTVFDLLVREQVVRQANRPVGKLHALCAKRVCAGAQAQAVNLLLPVITQDELAIYKRGRNADSGHKPKNASEADYHAATGLEALFGWLYLKGETQRINELFAIICKTYDEAKATPS